MNTHTEMHAHRKRPEKENKKKKKREKSQHVEALCPRSQAMILQGWHIWF